MRIYDLAKELGKRFDIKVKSSELAEEIRQHPEFKSVKDSIKSHASSVEQDVADRVTEIYAERHGGGGKSAAKSAAKPAAKPAAAPKAAAPKAAPKPQANPEQDLEKKKADEARRREEIRLRREQMQQQPRGAAVPPTRMMRPPIATGGAPPPPPRPMGAVPGRMAPPPPTLPGKTPAAPVPPQPVAPAPAPPAAAAPVAPATPAAAPAAAEKPASAPPKAQAAPQAPPQAPPRKSPPKDRPAQPQRGKGGPRRQARPIPPPTGSHSRASGDGQPAPPPMPKLRSDSPFVIRTQEEREEQARREARRSGPPQKDREDRERSGSRMKGRAEGKPDGPLVIPDMEAMSLKGSPGRRGRGGGGGKDKPASSRGKKGQKKGARVDVRPTRVYGLADEFRKPVGNRGQKQGPRGPKTREERKKTRPTGPVTVGSTMTLGEFAEKIKTPVAEIIKQLFLMGHQITINQLIEPELAEMVALEFDIELIVETESDETDIEIYRPEEEEGRKKARPPVVTIMGHVDHGKTTLLDAYRTSRVAEGEAGGITQHIGAYLVETPKGEIVFLDTPGHAAFTAMRARGAKATDIVILVVSADDGVMPQTVEAINHARDAGVPIIVAINKIDLPGANPQRVRNELMQHSVLPEELGGDNIFVEVSAKERINLEDLLDMVHLQAEVLELTADPDTTAEGVIIESHIDPLRGAVATVLVQKGTLRQGDVFVVGRESGRVRVMIDDVGKQIKEAGPAHPAEVIGLSGTPETGELFLVMAEERMAREIASRRVDRRRMRDLGTTRHVTLEGLHDLVAEGKLKELKIILKADVQGSLEAIHQALVKLSNKEVTVRVLHTGTGGITESDVNLANASDAVILGFHVRPDPAAASLAQQEGIEIKSYMIIYELIEEVEKAILGMLEKRYREVISGRAEIRDVFRISRIGNIAGCYVLDGEVHRNTGARLLRDSIVIYEGKVATLRRVKDDVAKVASGYECGITLENFNDIKEGDIIECFKQEEISMEELASAVQ